MATPTTGKVNDPSIFESFQTYCSDSYNKLSTLVQDTTSSIFQSIGDFFSQVYNYCAEGVTSSYNFLLNFTCSSPKAAPTDPISTEPNAANVRETETPAKTAEDVSSVAAQVGIFPTEIPEESSTHTDTAGEPRLSISALSTDSATKGVEQADAVVCSNLSPAQTQIVANYINRKISSVKLPGALSSARLQFLQLDAGEALIAIVTTPNFLRILSERERISWNSWNPSVQSCLSPKTAEEKTAFIARLRTALEQSGLAFESSPVEDLVRGEETRTDGKKQAYDIQKFMDAVLLVYKKTISASA